MDGSCGVDGGTNYGGNDGSASGGGVDGGTGGDSIESGTKAGFFICGYWSCVAHASI